jgi:hypothetical protein
LVAGTTVSHYRLEAQGLKSEITRVQAAGQAGDKGAERSREVERERGPAAIGGPFDPVASGYEYAGGARDPGKAAAILELRDLPLCRKKLGLADECPGPDGGRARVEQPDAGDGRSPRRPAFDVTKNRPNQGRRRLDFDSDVEMGHKSD